MINTTNKFIISFLCLIFCNTIFCAFLKERPFYLRECKLNDVNLVNCSTDQIQRLFNQLNLGIPDLKLQVDPFLVKRVILDNSHQNAPVSIKAVMTDVLIKGLGNTIVLESNMIPENFTWEAKFLLPKLQVDSNYTVDGRILIIPIQGSGKLTLETTNLKITMKAKTTLFDKDDFTFYNITSVKIHMTHLDNLKANIENLFGSNKELENSTNQFFNDNWKDLFQALRPVIRGTIEEILLNTLRNIARFIPANLFLSDLPKASDIFENNINSKRE